MQTVKQLFILLLLLSGSPLVTAETQGLSDFDHLAETGFELTPVHRLTACESCHLFGIFEGTRRTCRGCHGSQGIRTASRKGARHILSSDNCQTCHMTAVASSWAPVRRVDHLEVRGSCFSCHNNMLAEGRPPNHIPSSNKCDDCHNVRSWAQVRFTHDGIFGNCSRCHNGFIATGKNNQHIRSTNVCEACHNNTRVWVPVTRVDHNEIPEAVAGQCVSCHYRNSPYGGKPPTHVRGGIDSSDNCAACHGTTGNWPVLRMQHDELVGSAGTPGAGSQCQNCHQADLPPIPPHPPVAVDCGLFCHTGTRNWCSPPPLGGIPGNGLCGN